MNLIVNMVEKIIMEKMTKLQETTRLQVSSPLHLKSVLGMCLFFVGIFKALFTLDVFRCVGLPWFVLYWFVLSVYNTSKVDSVEKL